MIWLSSIGGGASTTSSASRCNSVRCAIPGGHRAAFTPGGRGRRAHEQPVTGTAGQGAAAASAASWSLRQSQDARGTARGRPWVQSGARRATDAPPRYPRPGRPTISPLHDRQPPFPSGRPKPAPRSGSLHPRRTGSRLADITYIATGDGWLYLAAVLDLATRKIVGWAMRDHMRTEFGVSG